MARRCIWPSTPRSRAGSGSARCCVRDGDLVRLAPGAPGIIDEVPAGRLYKDGSLFVDAEARTVADRRRLGFCRLRFGGARADRARASSPPIRRSSSPAFRKPTPKATRLAEIAYEAVLEAFESLPRARRRDPEAVAEAVRRAVRAALAAHWDKKPICHVHVLEV